jgi:hypothetical protein
MIATVIFDLTTAIALGVLVALLLLVRRLSKLEINIEAVDANRLSVDGEAICRKYGSARVVYIAGAMIFANTSAVEGILTNIPIDCDTVFFSMRGVSYLAGALAQKARRTRWLLRPFVGNAQNDGAQRDSLAGRRGECLLEHRPRADAGLPLPGNNRITQREQE